MPLSLVYYYYMQCMRHLCLLDSRQGHPWVGMRAVSEEEDSYLELVKRKRKMMTILININYSCLCCKRDQS